MAERPSNSDPNIAAGDSTDGGNSSGHLTMFDRWDADDKNPMQVWFDSIEELQDAITGFDEHGNPIFDPESGTKETVDDSTDSRGSEAPSLSDRADQLLSQGRSSAQVLQELMSTPGAKDSDVARVVKKALDAHGNSQKPEEQGR